MVLTAYKTYNPTLNSQFTLADLEASLRVMGFPSDISSLILQAVDINGDGTVGLNEWLVAFNGETIPSYVGSGSASRFAMNE
jgi:hypothetical protein